MLQPRPGGAGLVPSYALVWPPCSSTLHSGCP